MELQQFLKHNIEDIKQKGLYRELKTIASRNEAYVEYKGEKVLQASSNNYLGLAGDKRLEKAVIKAVQKYGVGSTGSRLITGTSVLHKQLEEKIARLKGTEKALVFSTGYAANLGVISSLLGKEDAVYSDELNHASIIDGIKLSRANKFIYKHCDVDNLEALLKANAENYRLNLIITDSIFSMDGDCAPLEKIVELKENYKAVLFLDEAHAFGVFGEKGQGLAHELGLQDKVDIQMGTLSKAAGSEGAYIAGSENLIDYLINNSRSFIYSTAPSVPAIAASLESVKVIETDSELRNKLKQNIEYLRSLLADTNLKIMHSDSAIFCIEIESIAKSMEISKKLLEEYRIMASTIRPPTVKTARIRICTMALHTKEDLEYLVECLVKVVES